MFREFHTENTTKNNSFFVILGRKFTKHTKTLGFFAFLGTKFTKHTKTLGFLGFFGFWEKKIKVIEPVIEQVIDDFEFFFVKTQKTKKTQCFCMFREFRTQKSQKCVICNRLHRSTIEYVPCNRVRAL